MKFFLKHIWIIASLFMVSSCEDFLNVNENPNVATQPPLAGLFAVGTYQTGLNHQRVAGSTSFYTQYFASPNAGLGNDVYEQVDLSGTWTSIYDVMTDIYDLIELANEGGSPEVAGAGKLLMATNLGLLADLWGDVPYSEAFTGLNIIPVYDNAQAIYNEIFALISAARSDLNASSSNTTLAKIAASDFILGGSKARWLQYSYALEARYKLHFSKGSSFDAAGILSAVSSAFQSNSDQAQVTKFEVRNPWASVAINNANLVLGGWLSEQFIDALNGTTFGVVDPRLAKITTPLPDGSYAGTANGAGRKGDGTVKLECYLENSRAYASNNSPLYVFTLAELKFIEAETALASDRNRALSAFLAGVQAHMADMGVSSTDADAYIEAAYPGLGAASLTLDMIMREKYVAMFLHPESWTDARRFNYQYKDFTLPANAELSEFIRRVQYPSVEITRNRQNVPIINTLTERLFWDN